ncbi:hypothetical protein F5Y04DRAFT_261597 [Hypomontagnella monticulosa]|nr:hypothetical protein F5Y04DRAFT_261597 [Hypomontagnella monticulosa]
MAATTSTGDLQPIADADRSSSGSHTFDFDGPCDCGYSTDSQGSEDEEHVISDYDFRFQKLGELICTRVEDAIRALGPEKADGKFDTRVQHNEWQRGVWQQIREEAVADEDIPTALFSPPLRSILVRVSGWPTSEDCDCCCDINEGDWPVIEIRAPKHTEEGVTKDMFVQQISEAMYGRAPVAEGAGYSGYWIGGQEDRPIVKQFSYMTRPRVSKDITELAGPIFALTKDLSPLDRSDIEDDDEDTDPKEFEEPPTCAEA